MRVLLPRQFDLSTVVPFLGEFLLDDGTPRGREVVFDFSGLRFVRPEAVTAFANAVRYLVSHGCSVAFEGVRVDASTPQKDPLKYLDDCAFFEVIFGRKIFEGSHCRSTSLPLTVISTTRYYPWIMNKVIPWLDSNAGIDIRRQLPEFSACLDEVFNNIIDHTGLEAASVHMQFYPAEHEVFMAVADFGVGIPANIRKIAGYGSLSDGECLEQAIKHGVSSKTTPRNRGAGLDTLLQNVIVHNKGRVRILSLRGLLTANPAGEGMSHAIAENRQPYPGTLILMTLRTDTIGPPDEEEEVFSWD